MWPWAVIDRIFGLRKKQGSQNIRLSLTLNLPTKTIVAQPFNVIKWQLKFNLLA
jgi:hypothetical protein